LGCLELLEAGTHQFLHLKKFHSKFEFQGSLDSGGSNGDSNGVFRDLELHCEESPTLHRKIADDLAATHPEVVYDPYPCMMPANVAENSI